MTHRTPWQTDLHDRGEPMDESDGEGKDDGTTDSVPIGPSGDSAEASHRSYVVRARLSVLQDRLRAAPCQNLRSSSTAIPSPHSRPVHSDVTTQVNANCRTCAGTTAGRL